MDRITPERRSRLMARVRNKNTSAEVALRSIVHRMGFRFRLHRKDLPGQPDLVFPAHKKIIFVHGCFWHGHSCRRGKAPSSNVSFWTKKIRTNRERDVRNIRALKALGWRTLVVWECDLNDAVRTAKALAKFLAD